MGSRPYLGRPAHPQAVRPTGTAWAAHHRAALVRDWHTVWTEPGRLTSSTRAAWVKRWRRAFKKRPLTVTTGCTRVQTARPVGVRMGKGKGRPTGVRWGGFQRGDALVQTTHRPVRPGVGGPAGRTAVAASF